MKLADIIEKYIPGDWGNEVPGDETPYEVSCIRGADIVPIENVDYSKIPYRHVSERSYNNRLLSVGDIIIEKSGGSPTQSTGRVSIVTEDLLSERPKIVCSNFCEAFRVKSDWNPWFVYYYFRYIYDQGVFFNFEGKTSGLKNLQMDNAFSSIEIEEIDRNIQDKIANAILNIDNKIAINHQINRKLEAMAKQIYDYWFVQFDFPDANGRPYKSSGGKMVYNETLKREIPEGWEDGIIEDIADVFNGATPSTATEFDYYGGDIVWITPKDLSDQDSKFIRQGKRNINQAGFDSCSTSMLPKGSILMSSRAPIGLISIADSEMCTNQGFKSFVEKRNGENYYLYYFLVENMKRIEQLGSGTTFKEVSRESILSLPVLMITNVGLFNMWVELIKPIFDKQALICAEISELNNQRDYFLPLLISGQITITQ